MRGPSLCFVSGSASFAILLVAALSLIGCDEETLGPESRGTIEGVVLDNQTDETISRANITTNPPTQSVLSDQDGTFELKNVSTGNYTVEGTKADYESRAVTVNVQEGQAVSATILLARGDNFESKSDSLDASITHWYNNRVNRDSSGSDSIFVHVEHRVENVGEVDIGKYEVYFELNTPEGTFSQEIRGDSLSSGEHDIGEFRKHVSSEADDVRIDDIYYEIVGDK